MTGWDSLVAGEEGRAVVGEGTVAKNSPVMRIGIVYNLLNQRDAHPRRNCDSALTVPEQGDVGFLFRSPDDQKSICGQRCLDRRRLDNINYRSAQTSQLTPKINTSRRANWRELSVYQRVS